MKDTVSAHDLLAAIMKDEARNARSAWTRGVYAAAYDMVNSVDCENFPTDPRKLESALLNGAETWNMYSYGGCALIYNRDIAERYFTPSIMARYMKPRHDAYMAFNGESLLDMQARALRKAFYIVARLAREIGAKNA